MAPVDPGRGEEPQLQALLERLRDDRPLRDSLSVLAGNHAREHLDPAETVSRLGDFLLGVLGRKLELEAAVAAERAPEGRLLGYMVDEVRGAARELGLAGAHVPLTPLFRELVGDGA